jgi:NADPH-dependent 2,4-dienoyl-CoA reductase/sulfur reductase-like enzyme
MEHIVVAGFSLAGLRCVEALRRAGYAGRITVVGEEPHLPYDRPPLSKDFLAGRVGAQEIALRKEGLGDLDLDLRLGRKAVALDVEARRVVLDDDRALEYDGLVVATGARPRRLPGQPDLDGVLVLRTLDDGQALRAAVERRPRRVVVVGAGFIGAEVAATCRGLRVEVTMIEALDAPMVRGLGARLGGVIADVHREEGVDLRLGTTVAAIEGDGRVERVRLGDGSVIDADVVVVGIGVVPNTEWLEGSGLTLDDGVVCDGTCRAAPGVVAAGDVCRFPNALFDGDSMRLEHWTNAIEQGTYVAGRLLADGRDEPVEPFAPVPFVWSDQYDVKIQAVGAFSAADEMRIVHGSVEERRFVAIFGRAGRLVGALAFSSARHLMQYRRLVADRASWDDALALGSQ